MKKQAGKYGPDYRGTKTTGRNTCDVKSGNTNTGMKTEVKINSIH